MLATGDRATASASVVRASAIPEPRGQWFMWLLALIVIGGLVFGGIYGWRKYAAHKRNAHPAPATTQEMRTIIRSTNSA
jgi:hypothetical protein